MGVRPSKLYDVSPKYTAWCFDRAVELFGRTLEERVRKAAQGAKDQDAAERSAGYVLDRWLSSGDPAGTSSVQRFRDPVAG